MLIFTDFITVNCYKAIFSLQMTYNSIISFYNHNSFFMTPLDSEVRRGYYVLYKSMGRYDRLKYK